MSDHNLARFMGGSPAQVILRLVFLSFVVGVILSALNLDPLSLFYHALDFIERLWNMGFAAVGNLMRYFVLGAIIVVPIWLLSRILSAGRGK
ncbi:DUF6460 domain-containing protein [Roseibium suaedae]|uniref:DUF6460 domain-containing protein n=1 Tax=Roseibium suaedae TaxID=735517 RepID=A0A1M7BFG9_9HYPH|nr:DUF6460 domain-containing protein [Roseibium suaedae]SHL53379.1 hypothetical protein SAMN05444272_0808 [Roseibium suaedae]